MVAVKTNEKCLFDDVLKVILDYKNSKHQPGILETGVPCKLYR